jgi:hypothetical protein
MRRNEFIKSISLTAGVLVAQGYLPLLGAEEKRQAVNTATGPNFLSEPGPIEPITGFLPQFSPILHGGMAGPFKARYELIQWRGAAARSINSTGGSMEVSWQGGCLNTYEVRGETGSAHTVKTVLQCEGPNNAVASWVLHSGMEGNAAYGFEESGTCSGGMIKTKAAGHTQQYAVTSPLLIARWSLLPWIASGALDRTPLTFDMLDDSAIRYHQRLRYCGEISVPVKEGSVQLKSYLQTGRGIVPTHYLVDDQGRVQLITMSFVNWALNALSGS